MIGIPLGVGSGFVVGQTLAFRLAAEIGHVRSSLRDLTRITPILEAGAALGAEVPCPLARLSSKANRRRPRPFHNVRPPTRVPGAGDDKGRRARQAASAADGLQLPRRRTARLVEPGPLIACYPVCGVVYRLNGGVMQISEGKPYPLGATADEKGTNFAVFSGAGDGRRDLHLRRARRARDRALRASRIHRRGVPRPSSRTSARGPSTAFASTAPTSRKRASASTPTSSCSILTRAPMPASSSGTTPSSATRSGRRGTISPSTSATARPSCRSRRSSTRTSTGMANTPPQRSLGPHPRLRDARQGLHQAPSRSSDEKLRGFYAGLARNPSSTTSGRSA